MTVKFQDVADLARKTLNDVDKDRHTDADLLLYAIAGIKELRIVRPDLFIGQFLTLPDTFALTDVLPIDTMYMVALADYVIARAESMDDEHVGSGRAAMFYQMASGQL